MSAAVFMNEEEMNVADLAKICRQETVLLSLSDATEATRIAEAITRSLHSGQVELVA